MVRGLHTASGVVPRAVTLFPAVKVFSHVGKVLGLDGRVAWPKATQKRTLCGPTTTSASWKDRKSTPQTATDSPQRQAPFPEDPDALQFWACYRARMSPKCGAPRGHHCDQSHGRGRSDGHLPHPAVTPRGDEDHSHRHGNPCGERHRIRRRDHDAQGHGGPARVVGRELQRGDHGCECHSVD
jgi:hypothetical protein